MPSYVFCFCFQYNISNGRVILTRKYNKNDNKKITLEQPFLLSIVVYIKKYFAVFRRQVSHTSKLKNTLPSFVLNPYKQKTMKNKNGLQRRGKVKVFNRLFLMLLNCHAHKAFAHLYNLLV